MKQLCAAFAVLLSLGVQPIAQSNTAPDILGEWNFTTVSPLGENTNTMVISKEGDGLKAVAKSPQGERPYDKIELSGTTITVVMTIDYEGSPMVINYSGTADDKVMNGSADFGGMAQGSFSAARK